MMTTATRRAPAVTAECARTSRTETLLAMPRRVVAAGIHFLVSACVAAIAAGVVFLVWYPPPFATIMGGVGLFSLLVTVDVVLGPMLTAVVASPAKPLPELRRDLAIIVALQVAAFGYGIWSIAAARPVYVSFEIDRYRVVTAADLEPATLAEAPPAMRSLPWLGPQVIAAVKPSDPSEQLRSLDLGLAGFDLSMVPKYWRAYATQRDAAWAAAHPIDSLVRRYPETSAGAADIARRVGADVHSLRFLPVMGRRGVWSAVVAQPDARIVGYLPVDGFL